jgi:hypothetical protein
VFFITKITTAHAIRNINICTLVFMLHALNSFTNISFFNKFDGSLTNDSIGKMAVIPINSRNPAMKEANNMKIICFLKL